MVTERRNKAERRLLEEDLHRGCVHRFSMVVGLGEKTDRVDAFALASGIPDVEIGDDRRCIQRCAIGEGHAVFEVKREFGGIVVLLPALGKPGADLTVGIDIKQLVGDMAPDMALKAGNGAVVRDPGVAERIDEEGNVAAIAWGIGCLNRSRPHRRQKRDCPCESGGQQTPTGEGKKRRTYRH